ncbi:TDRD1 protein, partial [Eolophus roseicapillus]|nr:TDRD1 protein [Eolophus roseicapilla]
SQKNSDSIHEKPKKSQYSFENVFSISCDESLFSSLVSPPRTKTCHHCGLFGSLRCSQCKQIYYCSTDCQKEDWPAHCVVCDPVKPKEFILRYRTCFLLYLEWICCELVAVCLGGSTSVNSLKTEEHVKKITLLDLQAPGIKKAMEVQGIVTEFKSPSEFYIQLSSPDFLDQISKLSLKLQDCYASTVTQEQYIATKGEVCVAKCSLDQTWNRALVKDVDILQKKSQVFYIDYGNEEDIPLAWIKALHKDIELLVPPCAIRCSFANYDPKEKGRNEDAARFSSQLIGKHCSVTVVDILQEEMMLSFAVEFVIPDSATSFFCLFGFFCTVSENHSKKSKAKIPQDEEYLHRAHSVPEDVSVCVGDVFSAMVSGMQSPEDFFCQPVRNCRQLADLQVSLNEHCDKLPSNPAFRPPVGNVCCAQFTGDHRWYRAVVVAYVSEEAVVAEYIDYGNSEVLPLTRLRPVIPRLMDLPAQAIRCTLAGVKQPLGGWTSEDICFMKRVVEDKVFTVKVVGKHSYKSVVELVDASVTPAINVSSHLIERGCRAEEPRMALPAIGMNDVKQANEDKTNKSICKWNKLTLEQTVDVVVCTLYSPGEFYCHISNNSELHALNLLNKSLSEYCQKTPPNAFKPENGEPCCAFFSGDGYWYRALVQSVSSGGTVKVCFVDYGNVEEVPLDKIRQISSSFLKLPFQGIKCWLSGIKPGSSKWIPEATARFHTYAVGIKLQARVTSLSRDGAGVELIDNSTGRPKVINELLTSEKLAVKEVLQEKNKLPNKPVDKKVIHFIFLLFLLETSLGRWKSIRLAIDETMSVCVTEVISPDLFYVVPVKTKGKKKYQLRKQLTELQDYCKSCIKEPFKPKPGEACCARFSGDGRWYRALVLKAFRSVVEVVYADYGNKETLPLSEVLPITDSYLKLPFQAITCSLAGIEKAGQSALLLDKLKEMLLNKCVTITVKGINGSVNLVTVEKLWENSSLNVTVREGLVKSSSAESLRTERQGNACETKCCCTELKIQLKKHEQILLFLLNKYGNPDGFNEMKKLLER